MSVAAPAAPAHGGSPAPLPPPPPVAPVAQPPPAAAVAPGTLRPDGYIKFLIWVGDQPREIWARRQWIVQNLTTAAASAAGFTPERAALIGASGGQGFNLSLIHI
eukprot:14996724-Alexandrium_andersonii.AAC.1